MSVQLLAKLLQPSGSVVIADALMSIQGEFYMIEMSKTVAENVWDVQNVIYTIETNSELVGKFGAICTGFIPYMRDGEEMARASFVRSEFVTEI
jgi:hypothetical protein